MIMIKHTEFTKFMTDGGKTVARIHKLVDGSFACIQGDFRDEKIVATREAAEQWLVAAVLPVALAETFAL